MKLFAKLFPAANLSRLQRRNRLGIDGSSTHALEAKVMLAVATAQPKKVASSKIKSIRARRTTPGSSIKALLNKLSIPKFNSDVATLAKYPNRHSTTENYVKASEWASKQLAGAGLKTNFQSITVNGKKSRNVIGTKAGTNKSGKEILVVAHLDSVNHDSNKPATEAVAPGADDNASGSAGVLQLARALKNVDTKHTMRFILVGGEEQGLFGSKQYVSKLSSAQKSKIDFVINMDMIGSQNGKSPAVLLEGSNKSPAMRNLISGLTQAAKEYTNLKVNTSFKPADSDHVPFIQAGIPAVLTIEGGWDKNDRIHTAKDTLGTVNAKQANEILRMNLAYIASKTVA
jgi:Zn-dependent M28 family amino/carboxypeptidase